MSGLTFVRPVITATRVLSVGQLRRHLYASAIRREQTTPVESSEGSSAQSKQPQSSDAASPAPAKKRTLAELDAEMMARLEDHSGEGGAAGLELEDGQAVAMKRGGTCCSNCRVRRWADAAFSEIKHVQVHMNHTSLASVVQ
jgi:hypothetical protein